MIGRQKGFYLLNYRTKGIRRHYGKDNIALVRYLANVIGSGYIGMNDDSTMGF
jgi:hypothetical protein